MKDNEVYAAIAMALHEHQGHTTHDSEAGVITIKGRNSEWETRILSMTQHP